MANTTVDMEKQPLLEEQPQEAPEQEPTLQELQQQVREAQRRYFKAWSKSTSGKWNKRIMIGTTFLVTMFMVFCFGVVVTDSLTDDGEVWHYPARVPLEAHIMSKCPDAKDCLHDMILPAMQNISDKVDFKLSYIGTNTADDDGVLCQHGSEECLGNIIELCAAHLYPNPKTYLGFTMCMSRQYDDIPKQTLVEDCALEHSVSMDKLNSCIDRDEGRFATDMLRESFNRTKNADVSKSCTVRLDGEVRCVRDGGEWKMCEGGHSAEDLVADVMKLYQAQWEY
ncbi:uncharacterized protein LTR77_009025 [Saxophila tyrrhenica]|uniref:Uncharacterized protein n=1 Tax=Saxophila tyrrhenica TaxID=1690608 RepID=A0AAV9P282_9PEZI|nr:hypothetical protein LTR77_009025 [Saxophila tyrrhenica]